MYKISPAVEHFFNTAKPKERVAATITAIESSRSESPDPDTLAKLSGWGSIKDIIWKEDKYLDLRGKLADLLTEEELDYAKTGTFWSFHTSFPVIRYMWNMAKLTGFDGGRIIESGCGAGHYFGLIPAFDRPCELWGVEIDPIPAAVCQSLYPEAHVANADFREFKAPEGYFDLAIGNVPFGDTRIYDDAVYDGGISIHNYFLAKNLKLVREGGLVMIATSSFALDSRDQSFREWVAGKAELVDITPLPNNAFKKFANTEVCAHILTFRKYYKNEVQLGVIPDWVKTTNTLLEEKQVRTNLAIAKAFNLV